MLCARRTDFRSPPLLLCFGGRCFCLTRRRVERKGKEIGGLEGQRRAKERTKERWHLYYQSDTTLYARYVSQRPLHSLLTPPPLPDTTLTHNNERRLLPRTRRRHPPTRSQHTLHTLPQPSRFKPLVFISVSSNERRKGVSSTWTGRVGVYDLRGDFWGWGREQREAEWSSQRCALFLILRYWREVYFG